jgi:BirA family biotin operon repressor/biotin-[acetyl-CoA-carboxylase] ligase
VAGVAAHDVLGATTTLKWPNDVLVGEAKVAGVLAEAGSDLVVVGMGVNLYWPSPPSGVAALERVDPGPELGPRLATSWAEELLEIMERPASEWPRRQYRGSCSTIGREISWEPDGRGLAVDVDDHGALVVETDDGQVLLTAGAVRHVRPLPP